MLTTELLKGSPALAGLTDEQLTAIAEMSQNDENAVIGRRIGELHGQYDKDILAITGQAKGQGEKTYDFLKRVYSDMAQKVKDGSTTAAQLANANKTIDELKAKIASGSADESLKQQLKDAITKSNQLQAQITANVAAFDKERNSLKEEVKNVHLDYAFKAATSGMKFKAGITDAIAGILLGSAKGEVLTKGTPDFIDDGLGGKKLVFRDATGAILNNPANNLNPYTVEELLMQTSLKDVIDTGKKTPGGGTTPDPKPAVKDTTYSIGSATTQVEADNMLEEQLLANGLTRDSHEFHEELLKARIANGVDKLPIR